MSFAAAPVAAATPAASAAPAVAPSEAAARPAALCLGDIRTFSAEIQKNGYGVGSSDYGYGYPLGEYGYGFGYPIGDYQGGTAADYHTARPGYQTRNLAQSAKVDAYWKLNLAE
jgi:hypothetical protein